MSYKSKWLSPSPRKPRINWKLEFKKERARVLVEAIELMRDELKRESLPESFKRGHYAAITILEIMKDKARATNRAA